MSNTSKKLGRRFVHQDVFKSRSGDSYDLLPFRFLKLDSQRYVLTNFSGEYLVLPRATMHAFANKELQPKSPLYDKLKSKHFLIDGDSDIALELLAAKYRTRQLALSQFTGLHILIPTLRCNSTCVYCQASRQPKNKAGFDMTESIADRAIDFMFMSPSPGLKVEFQGGEPLLNFDMVKYIVERVEERNLDENRSVEYVICSNLTLLTDAVLKYCEDHKIYFSTSLDGPKDIHNKNRYNPDLDSYEATCRGIAMVMEALGPERVSALVTTTRVSLSESRRIVDEYLERDLNSIFLRMINPYGLAAKTPSFGSYSVDEWLDFYKSALEYILEVNCQGVSFREEYAAVILKKMLTPYATGFVDLQSPAGIGIGVLVYNYDGAVYASDESRMLAEMGDKRFLLGHLMEHSYEDIMLSDSLLEPLSQTITDCMPGCSDCGVMPYCGSDPVRHYRTQEDIVGYKPTSDFCMKNMEIIRHLIGLLESDDNAAEVLTSWI